MIGWNWPAAQAWLCAEVWSAVDNNKQSFICIWPWAHTHKCTGRQKAHNHFKRLQSIAEASTHLCMESTTQTHYAEDVHALETGKHQCQHHAVEELKRWREKLGLKLASLAGWTGDVTFHAAHLWFEVRKTTVMLLCKDVLKRITVASTELVTAALTAGTFGPVDAGHCGSTL